MVDNFIQSIGKRSYCFKCPDHVSGLMKFNYIFIVKIRHWGKKLANHHCKKVVEDWILNHQKATKTNQLDWIRLHNKIAFSSYIDIISYFFVRMTNQNAYTLFNDVRMITGLIYQQLLRLLFLFAITHIFSWSIIWGNFKGYFKRWIEDTHNQWRWWKHKCDFKRGIWWSILQCMTSYVSCW